MSDNRMFNILGASRGSFRGGRSDQIGPYYRDRKNAKKREYATKTLKFNQNTKRHIKWLIDFRRSSDSSFNRNLNKPISSILDEDENFQKMYQHIEDSQFKRKFLNIVSGNIQESLTKSINTSSKLKRNTVIDEKFHQEHTKMVNSKEYTHMLQFREKLPAYDKRQEILDLLEEHQVILISGETGCGKTTQVAQFILDNEILRKNGSITKIVCTQPRRISAISVAERVASERGEKLGRSVGFQIRLEKVLSRRQGCIMFCTTGILLQFVQSNPALTNISHIIIDEVHERSIETDFIITLLKQVIPKRPDLKVILMSATLNSDKFSKYYGDCPSMHIPGFTFPVEEFYLEDAILFTGFQFPVKTSESNGSKWNKQLNLYLQQLEAEKKYPPSVIKELRNPKSEKLSLELIEKLIFYICCSKGPGAILVFLPGIMDITNLYKMLSDGVRYPSDKYVIYPLHSKIPTLDQKLIFDVPEDGVRKIIISTSIAESSITIEDVVYVIDCGKSKISRFDVKNNIQTLLPEWETIANAQQRRGRAGRVQPGICFHLYSKVRESTFDPYPLPEMLRSRLEEVILQIKILQLGKASDFLANVMDSPDPMAINISLDLLKTLNALDANERLTPLGYHLAQLPLDPRTGKMILWAALFSCIDPIFSIAASLSYKDAFYCPLDKQEEAQRKKIELGMGQSSDHIALAEALKRYEMIRHSKKETAMFCKEYFLSQNTLQLLFEMKIQFARYLHEMKFLKSNKLHDIDANRNSNNFSLIKAIVTAGLYPNLATVKGVTVDRARRRLNVFTLEDGEVRVHPSSINGEIERYPNIHMTYFWKKRSTAIYLHDTTFVSPWALMFANPKRLSACNLINCESETAWIMVKLRKKFDDLLEHKITHPGTINWMRGEEGRIIDAMIVILSQGEYDMGLMPQKYPQRF